MDFISKDVLDALWERGYDVLRVIGAGTYGKVYACVHWARNLKVAVKIVARERTSIAEHTLWRTLDHPNILPALDVVWVSRSILFIMPLHDKTLEQYLVDVDFRCREGAFDVCKLWLRDVLLGLDYLHTRKFCHLDLKINNVLITSELKAVVCDFTTLTSTERRVTRYALPQLYCPPEVNFQADFDGVAFDVWAYGALTLTTFVVEWFALKRGQAIGPDWHKDLYPGVFEILQTPLFAEFLRRTYPNAQIEDQDVTDALNLVRGTLRHRPQDRPRTSVILQHPILAEEGATSSLEPDRMWVARLSPLEMNLVGQPKGAGISTENDSEEVKINDDKSNEKPDKTKREDVRKSRERILLSQIRKFFNAKFAKEDVDKEAPEKECVDKLAQNEEDGIAESENISESVAETLRDILDQVEDEISRNETVNVVLGSTLQRSAVGDVLHRLDTETSRDATKCEKVIAIAPEKEKRHRKPDYLKEKPLSCYFWEDGSQETAVSSTSSMSHTPSVDSETPAPSPDERKENKEPNENRRSIRGWFAKKLRLFRQCFPCRKRRR